jgi:ketosteroid isomerase-like protein
VSETPVEQDGTVPAGAAANLALVQRLYDAMAAKDIETLLQLFDPEVVVEQTPELPWGGRHVRHEGLGHFFLTLVSSIESQVTIEQMFAAGDRVVQVGRTAGRVVANGREFDVAEVHIHTIAGGRVVRFEAHIDTPAMLAALNG